jgi:hypothetical protein
VLKDSVGNLMPEITVNFETDLGTLSSHVEQTDISGIAKTELTSTNYEGTATITATSFVASYIKVEFKESVPVFAEISSDSTKLLADGISETKIIAKVYDSANKVIPGAVFDFSTNLGSLDYAEGVRANQEGEAEVTFTSSGSAIDTTVIIKAVVAADKSISEEISIKLRGITSITYIDSTNMSDYGIYKAYIRTHLRETTSGKSISDGAVYFSAPVGTMNYPLVEIDEQGTAESVFNIEVLPINQNNIIITSELSSAPEVFSATNVLTVPGAELLVSTIDDVIMGDSEGYALVKATLRESDGNAAIPLASITWTTTMGTIIGTSSTNSIGNTIDTLVIESAVNQAANITVTANFGDYVSDNEVLTFIPPVNDNRLILGFEPDTTDLGIVPCDLYNSIAIKEGGISALFVSGNGYGIPGEEIHFSIVPNNFAAICSITYTSTNGVAMVMFAYPPQSSGQIIRVWGEAFDGTKGSIDIILP